MKTLGLPLWRLDSALPVWMVVAAGLGIGPLIAWTIAEEEWRWLAALLLATAIPIALRWPIMALGAYAFVLPFDSVAIVADTGGSTVTRFVGIVAAGVLLAAGVMERRLVRPPLAALWVVLLFLWIIVTFGWALQLELARAWLSTAVSLVAMYLVAVSFRASKKELIIVGVFTMLGGALAATAGVILGFEANVVAKGRGTLAVGEILANPNGVAQNLLLPLAMAWAVFLASRCLRERTFAVLCVSAITVAILLTMARGSLAAVAIMMCVFLYRLRVRWQVLAIVGILIALLPFMPELLFERVGRLFTGEDTTGSGRTDIWQVGIQALQEFGWFGAGLSNFPAVYNMYAYTDSSRGAHNTFLQMWVELGAIGILLLVAVFWSHLRINRPTKSSLSEMSFPIAIEAACLGFMILALVGDVLWRKATWMPWILAVWASRIRADRPVG
jgi:O-antigen ligase